jgi:EmrB/QacA subfamily drug resistance transporter
MCIFSNYYIARDWLGQSSLLLFSRSSKQMKQSTKYAIAFTAAIGGFMATLELTVINVALSKMAESLKTDLSNIQWVVTASFLAVAAAIPVAGYLGNRYGLRRFFMVAVVLFTFGSVLCGLSGEIGWLIAFRVIQGLGGGGMTPLGQAVALSRFEPQERAKALGIVAMPILLAPAIGPSLGGFLTENFGWQWIFFMNLPLGLLCLFLTWRVIPRDEIEPSSQRQRFDYIGLISSMVGIVLVVYALNLVSQTDPATRTALNPRGDLYGWGYWLVWTLLGIGLAVLVGCGIYELRGTKDPVIELRLFQRYDYAVSSIFLWITRAVSYAALILIPIYLQQVRLPHFNVQDAGVFLIPQGLATAVGVPIGMVLYKKLGARVTVLIMLVIMAASSWPLTQLSYNMDAASLQPWLILRGLTLTAIFMPVNSLAIEKLTGALLAKGTSLFNVTMQIAGSMGVALATTLFVQQTTQRAGELAGQNLPPAQLGAQAATAGLNDVFFYALIGTVLLLLPALLLPGRPPKEVKLETEAGAETAALS